MKVLVTAGPTREALDPVRFLSNHSSGKMGFALAEAFAQQGHEVCLVTGPVSLEDPQGVRVVRVQSAADMHQAVMQEHAGTDVFVMAAAVADYQAREVLEHKKTKDEKPWTLELQRTPDILKDVVQQRKPGQLVVGFCLESQDLLARAHHKRQRKGADIMIANATTTLGADTIEAWWVDAFGERALPKAGKQEVARHLAEQLARLRLGEVHAEH